MKVMRGGAPSLVRRRGLARAGHALARKKWGGGMSRDELAERIGVEPGSRQFWER